MSRGLAIGILLAAACLLGACQGQAVKQPAAGPHDDEASIELWYDTGWHAFLTARGYAYVEVGRRRGVGTPMEMVIGEEPVRVLVPTSPAKTEALLAVLDAAKAYAMAGSHEHLQRIRKGRDKRPPQIRWRRNGQAEVLFLTSGWSSQLWNGIVCEVYYAGGVAVAEALCSQMDAEQLASEGKLREACDRYRESLVLVTDACGLRGPFMEQHLSEPSLQWAEGDVAYEKREYADALDKYRTSWAEDCSVETKDGVFRLRLPDISKDHAADHYMGSRLPEKIEIPVLLK